MKTRVMLKNVRLAFPVLDKPEAFQGQGEPRYSATLLADPDSENHKLLHAAMKRWPWPCWPRRGST